MPPRQPYPNAEPQPWADKSPNPYADNSSGANSNEGALIDTPRDTPEPDDDFDD